MIHRCGQYAVLNGRNLWPFYFPIEVQQWSFTLEPSPLSPKCSSLGIYISSFTRSLTTALLVIRVVVGGWMEGITLPRTSDPDAGAAYHGRDKHVNGPVNSVGV